MAIVWAESFEQYDNADQLWEGPFSDAWQTGLLVTDGTPRTGSNYISVGTSGTFGSDLRRTTPEVTQFGYAFGFRAPALPASNTDMGWSFRDGNSDTIFALRVTSNGAIQIQSEFDGTTLAQSGPRLLAGTWHHIEVQAIISSSVGQVEVRVDGVSAVAVSGVDLGSEPMGEIMWHADDGSHHVDDLVFYDFTGDVANDWLGPVRVVTVYPEIDASSIPGDWSVTGAGSGADAVSGVPDDDTSYIQADEAGYRATFGVGALPENIGGIVGVYAQARSKQIDAGSSSIRLKMQSNAAETVGDTEQLTPTYTYNGWAFTIDPDANDAWTKTTFEAAIIEIERVS